MPVSAPECREGCYLTDGLRLLYVIDACSGNVLLEDCRHPEHPPVEVPVREILQARMRVVGKESAEDAEKT